MPPAVIVPLATWQAELGVEDARHAPLARLAFASRPGGSANVMSLGESPADGENVASKPTVAGLVPPVVVFWLSVSAGVIVADAAAGSASAAAAVTSPTRARLARSDTWQIPPLGMSF